MKFLLILPLLVSSALSTFFVHKNVHKDCEESKPLAHGLINSHFMFLGHKLPTLMKNIQPTITGVQNLNYPIGGSFWTNFRYPFNSRSNPAYQSSRSIPQAPLPTHLLITDSKDKWPIIAYREIKPEVGGANIPIIMSMYPYGMNTAFQTQAKNIEGTHYGRNNLNSVVEENFKEVFSAGKPPYQTDKGTEEETRNIGGQRFSKTNSYPQVNTPFIWKISNREKIGAYPNTRNEVIQNLPLALGHVFTGVTGQPGQYPIQNQLPIHVIGFSPPPVFEHYNKPSQPWMDNNSRFPLPGAATQRYPGANEQSPLPGGATGQYSTAIGVNIQYPQQGGALQRYPPLGVANGQFLLQSGAVQRYSPLNGANEQFVYTSGVNGPYFPPRNDQYPPQGGAFGQIPTQTLSYERYPPKAGDNLNTSLKENNPPLNNVGEGVFVSSRIKENEPRDGNVTNVENVAETGKEVIEKGLSAIKAPPAAGAEGITTEVVVEKGLIAIKAPSSTSLKENNPPLNNVSKGVFVSSRIKENEPRDGNVTNVENVAETGEEVIEKELSAIKAPPAAGAEGITTEVVVEKGLIAIKAPSIEKVESDVKSEEAIYESPSSIEDSDNEIPRITGEDTKIEDVVEKGSVAIKAPSSEEVKGDVSNEEDTQISSVILDAPDNEASLVAEVEETKPEVEVEKELLAIEAPSSEEVKGSVKDEENIKNEPTNIKAADNKETQNVELPKLEKTVDVAESPLIDVLPDNTEADSIIGRLADIKEPFDENLVDAQVINEPNKTNATSVKESFRENLLHGSIDEPDDNENKPDKEIVEGTKSGPEEVDTELIHISSDNAPAEKSKVTGKEYVSEIAPRPNVSKEKVYREPETSPAPEPISGRELDENNSKMRTRDTTNVLEEPQTISFTIHLPPKTITTKVVSQVSEHKTKDGNEVNVVPIQRVETVEQKGGSSGHIEPTVMNGPNGVQITFGSSGNGINQQGGDSTHVINLGSILGLAQA